jgi:hypothetical protein
MLNRCWTKKPEARKTVFLHIRSCGYAAGFPQSGWFAMQKDRLQPFRMRRLRPVLPVDKTEVEQCLLFFYVAMLFLL